MADHVIRAEQLTTWAVTDGGERVDIGFVDQAGLSWAINFPIAVLSGLMMTIPRMVRQALRQRFADESMRMVHHLGRWHVERAVGADAFLLSLTTVDGFEVTFAVPVAQADRFGETLRRAASGATIATPVMN